jgi:hypothetical protein
MFVAGELVYLELQKTGGTHVRRLLQRHVGGTVSGKHNRLPVEAAHKFVFGSIRNPWDWYVSLWAYGVGGRGAVRARCVSGIDFGYYHRLLPRSMGKNWLTPGELLVSVYHDAVKPVPTWQDAYGDASDPDHFRAWLHLVLDSRRRFDIGEGYGFSPLSSHAGLLTYRYLRLFTLGERLFKDKRLRSMEGITEYDREFNIASAMIRTECLEDDFIRVLRLAGYTLADAQVAAIRRQDAGKTNASQRRPAEYYYDAESLALVAERERFLIEKYRYDPPKISADVQGV